MRVAEPFRGYDVRVDTLRLEIGDDVIGPTRGQVDVVGNPRPLQRGPDLQVVGITVDDDLGGLRSMTSRSRGDSLGRIIDDLNPMLRGWFGYFNTPRQLCSASSTASCAAAGAPSCASRKSALASGGARPTISLAQPFLRSSRLIHPSRGLRASETLPMRKPTTGEPCAGEPHARFGGWGGLKPFPTLSRENEALQQRIPDYAIAITDSEHNCPRFRRAAFRVGLCAAVFDPGQGSGIEFAFLCRRGTHCPVR